VQFGVSLGELFSRPLIPLVFDVIASPRTPPQTLAAAVDVVSDIFLNPVMFHHTPSLLSTCARIAGLGHLLLPRGSPPPGPGNGVPLGLGGIVGGGSGSGGPGGSSSNPNSSSNGGGVATNPDGSVVTSTTPVAWFPSLPAPSPLAADLMRLATAILSPQAHILSSPHPEALALLDFAVHVAAMSPHTVGVCITDPLVRLQDHLTRVRPPTTVAFVSAATLLRTQSKDRARKGAYVSRFAAAVLGAVGDVMKPGGGQVDGGELAALMQTAGTPSAPHGLDGMLELYGVFGVRAYPWAASDEWGTLDDWEYDDWEELRARREAAGDLFMAAAVLMEGDALTVPRRMLEALLGLGERATWQQFEVVMFLTQTVVGWHSNIDDSLGIIFDLISQLPAARRVVSMTLTLIGVSAQWLKSHQELLIPSLTYVLEALERDYRDGVPEPSNMLSTVPSGAPQALLDLASICGGLLGDKIPQIISVYNSIVANVDPQGKCTIVRALTHIVSHLPTGEIGAGIEWMVGPILERMGAIMGRTTPAKASADGELPKV
jgi:hypothetical protein